MYEEYLRILSILVVYCRLNSLNVPFLVLYPFLVRRLSLLALLLSFLETMRPLLFILSCFRVRPPVVFIRERFHTCRLVPIFNFLAILYYTFSYILFFGTMHRPGIEPGAIAWKATMLPLH